MNNVELVRLHKSTYGIHIVDPDKCKHMDLMEIEEIATGEREINEYGRVYKGYKLIRRFEGIVVATN